jgi:hypothetical protein
MGVVAPDMLPSRDDVSLHSEAESNSKLLALMEAASGAAGVLAKLLPFADGSDMLPDK